MSGVLALSEAIPCRPVGGLNDWYDGAQAKPGNQGLSPARELSACEELPHSGRLKRVGVRWLEARGEGEDPMQGNWCLQG